MDKILTFALPPIIGMPLSRLFSSWHTTLDRDVNAAINILVEGMKSA